jgi:hypothetical protein
MSWRAPDRLAPDRERAPDRLAPDRERAPDRLAPDREWAPDRLAAEREWAPDRLAAEREWAPAVCCARAMLAILSRRGPCFGRWDEDTRDGSRHRTPRANPVAKSAELAAAAHNLPAPSTDLAGRLRAT